METLATGGFKLTRENDDKLKLHTGLEGLDERPTCRHSHFTVLFCLDNSSFLAASEEGGLTPRRYDMNRCSQMQGDKNWVLPKEINAPGSSWTLIGWKSGKTTVFLYGTEWRERGFGLRSPNA